MKFFAGLVFTIISVQQLFAIAAGRLPGDTITNSKGTTLQFSVRNDVLTIERRLSPKCKQPRVTQTQIMGEIQRAGRMMKWDERWTLTGCGTQRQYVIHFSFRGSVGNYKIEAPHA